VGPFPHGQRPGHDIEFEHGRRGISAGRADDLGLREALAVAQSLVRGDQHDILGARVPVDDLVLELALDLRGVLDQHAHVLAVRIDGYQAREGEDDAVPIDAFEAAQQTRVGRPAAPAHHEVLRLGQHRLRRGLARLERNYDGDPTTAFGLDQHDVRAIRRDRRILDVRTGREIRDRGRGRARRRGERETRDQDRQ
jgi:hypothetical protein